MRNLENNFENKIIDYNKLLEYGFKKEKNNYILKTKILDNQFEIIINISENKKTSKIMDLMNNEEYILVDIEDCVGEFVGKIREEYNNKLQEIINCCSTLEKFKSNQAKEIIKYVKEKYNDELEFLWKKYDDNAIWRNKENNKWYGLLLTIQKNKLGINSQEKIEIIDLRYKKEEIENIIDNNKIFPGYHMNKKSWITIKLDNSVDLEKIIELIDNSYNLSNNKN